MALVTSLSGVPQARDPNGNDTLAVSPGAATNVATSAASANGALPLDANGSAYAAFMITCSNSVWFAFGTSGGDAVVAGTAPAFVVAAGQPMVLKAPKGATNFAAIQVAAGGFVSVVGVY